MAGSRDLDLEIEEYERELERELEASGEYELEDDFDQDDLDDLDEDDLDAAPPRRAARRSDLADEWIDQLLPERVDWRRLVREHPWPAIGLAAVGGYILGRTRGSAVVAALSAFAAGAVADGLNEALGEDVL